MSDRPPRPPHEKSQLSIPTIPELRPTALIAKPAPKAPAGPSPFDDDDDDMEIDRNVANDPMAIPHVGRARAGAPRGGGLEPGRAAGYPPGLEIDRRPSPAERWRAGEEEEGFEGDDERTLLFKILDAVLVLASFGGAGYALVRFAHRGAGWRFLKLAPAAFDGSSMGWSGGMAVGLIAVAAALGVFGWLARPRSWGYFLGALGALVSGAAMVTVTMAITPEGLETPPDGARLLPWILPIVPLGVALRWVRSAWTKGERGGFFPRVVGILVAGAAALAAFAALELLCGAGLRIPI
jgi:hypothetical protein